jgi:DNA-binding PadR family transcriptional regulator
MIDTAILGLLKDQDLHGYELRKRLDELPGSRATVSFGSLYPALGRLEKAGYVKAVTFQTTPTPAVPMSGSLTGELAAYRALRRRAASPEARGQRSSRGKKVYGLTDEGDRRLRELLADPNVADDRDFQLRVAFCHHLTPEQRLDLFRHRRAELERRQEQAGLAGSGGRLTTYLRSLLEHDTKAVTADLAWLDGLIAAEAKTGPDEADGTEKDRGDTR